MRIIYKKVNKRANRDIYKENINMKEYIKLFEGLNAANGYEINDIPFTSTIKSVSGEDINLLCNKHNASIIIENGEPKILTEVTITGTWNPSVSDKNTKVIISGNVVLCGKTDCYSIEFAQGGHLTINGGARLRVWEGGIVNNDAETTNYLKLIEDCVNNSYGEFLLHPNVSANIHPKASIEFTTYGCYYANPGIRWHAFGIPAYNNLQSIVYETSVQGVKTWIYDYNYQIDDWNELGQLDSNLNANSLNRPFSAYMIECSSSEEGTKYIMTGQLVGNSNQDITLNKNLLNYLSNSYIGHVNIETLYNNVRTLNLSMSVFVHGQEISVTDTNVDELANVAPQQAFYVRNNTSQDITLSINYKTFVWDASFEEDAASNRGLQKGNIINSTNDNAIHMPQGHIINDLQAPQR